MPAYRSRTTTHGRNMAGARGLWRATGMTDADFGTYWGTGDARSGHWARLDLETSCELAACRLMWQNPGYVYQYQIEVSENASNWTQVVDMTTNNVAIRLPVHLMKARGRYVRLTLADADDGCWPALAEFEVFGPGQVSPGQSYTPFRSSFGTATPARDLRSGSR